LVTAVSLDVLAFMAAPANAQQAPPADAGAKPSDELQEVVVTGFRASLEDALAKKRASNQIIESVTAEDIGKFPDQNVAESLQRLSGVQIDRTTASEGTKVRIRGLDYNITLLDEDFFLTGLELYGTGEGAGGGGNRYRDSLESVPTDLIAGVDVFKSPQANQLEGAIGGTINLRLRRALDLKEGLTFGANIRTNRGNVADEWKPNAALVGSYNFENRFGITASVSYDKEFLHDDQLAGQNRGGWLLVNSDGLFRSAGQPAYISPELFYMVNEDQDRKRVGASLGFDWKPGDTLSFSGEWFHSKQDVSIEQANNKVWFDSNNLGRGPDPSQPFSVDPNGVVTEGTFRALGSEVNSNVQATDVKADNFQFSGRWDGGGQVRVNFKGSYSKATLGTLVADADVEKSQYAFPNPDPSSPTGWSSTAALNPTAPGTSGAGVGSPYSFHYVNGNGKFPTVTYLAPFADLLTNPAYSIFKSHWVFGIDNDNKQYAARADLEWDPPFIENKALTFSSGIRYAHRKTDYGLSRFLVDWSNQGNVGGDTTLNLQDGSQFSPPFGPFFYFQDPAIGNKGCDVALLNVPNPTGTGPNPVSSCNRFGSSPRVITPVQSFQTNPERVETISNLIPSGATASGAITVQSRAQMRNPVAWLQSLYPGQPIQEFGFPEESFKVAEKTYATYLMGDLGRHEDRYHVNFGARIVRTQLTVDQNSPVGGGRFWGSDTWNGVTRDFQTIETGRTYTDVLPSFNAVLDVTENSKVRLSAARTVSRQSLFDLGRGFNANFTRQTRNGVDGFAFTSANAGNAELDPFRASQYDLGFEQYIGREGAIIATVFWKEVDSFVFTQTDQVVVPDDFGGTAGPVAHPVNGKGGEIKGFELGGQYVLPIGLGFNANYTYSDSKSPLSTSFDSNLPIPGVSKSAYNAQVFFERFGLGARLSYTWRSKSLDPDLTTFSFPDTANGTVTNYGVWRRKYGQLDAQVSYDVTQNFSVALEGINLTEEDQSEYLQFPNQPFTFKSGDRRVLIGVRARF
jgi:TonB-dependent receptor